MLHVCNNHDLNLEIVYGRVLHVECPPHSAKTTSSCEVQIVALPQQIQVHVGPHQGGLARILPHMRSRKLLHKDDTTSVATNQELFDSIRICRQEDLHIVVLLKNVVNAREVLPYHSLRHLEIAAVLPV